MSAQTILSVLAPTVPTAVASGVGDMLASEDGAAFESLLPDDETTPGRNNGEEVAPSIMAAPAPLPSPPPTIPVLLAPVASEPPPQIDIEVEAQPAPPTPAPVLTESPKSPEATTPALSVSPSVPSIGPRTASVPTPAAVSQAAPQPPRAETAPVEPETAPTDLAPTDKATEQPAAKLAPTPAPANAAPAPPTSRPVAQPVLRERHASSGERLAAGAMEPPPSSSVNISAASASPAAAAAATPAAPAASAPQPPAPALVAADAPTAEPEGQAAPPPLDSQAPTTAGRDVSLSGLSRGAIETTAQIAAQIVRRLEGRSTRFDMALTPEHLGRVDVSLEISEDGRLAARLAFDNPAAATDLRGRADELRRQLQDAGFQLADDALEFTERHDHPGAGADGFERRPDRRAFASASRLAVAADVPPPAPSRWMSLSLTPERVDLKV